MDRKERSARCAGMEGDAYLWIENRFRILAHLYGFNPDEPEHGANPARSVFVQLKHAQTSLRPNGGDSVAHWKRDNAWRVGMMFHVKQFLIHNSEF